MAIPSSEETQPARQENSCFLCTLDSRSCVEQKISGRIVTAYERFLNGEHVPFLTLDTGLGRITIALPRYYRSLVKDMKDRGREQFRRMHLQMSVYHLYQPETLKTDADGRSHVHYTANTYTLAVLEPDILMNITELNQADYCSRQYLLQRLVPSTFKPAKAIEGNLIHTSFKELLKAHGRNKQSGGDARQTLQHHFEKALKKTSFDLALSNVSEKQLQEEVGPHLESLANWFEQQSSTLWDFDQEVRAETFLLAPELGLRGRMDLFWQNRDRNLLELKTGAPGDDLPRSSHVWQVKGYHALLTARRQPRMRNARATLVYSGTPGLAQGFGIPFNIRELQKVIERRNLLVLMHLTGAPPMAPGPQRCNRCAMLDRCFSTSQMLNWSPPAPDPEVLEARMQLEPSAFAPPDQSDGLFLSEYYRLLQMEERENDRQLENLWKLPIEARLALGRTIANLRPLDEPLFDEETNDVTQRFSCENTSELRVGDEILLSNERGPIEGEVVTGTITGISTREVTVWTPEPLDNPRIIDRYDTDIVHVRTLQNLVRWLRADPHLRALVTDNTPPRFTDRQITPAPDFNEQQNLALQRALQMEDYLLIQGPPGTGKTSVIAEIVKRLCADGQKVMLAAFTNQAVDNMLRRLSHEGLNDYLRLGHERSITDENIKQHLFQHLCAGKTSTEEAYRLLREMPVVASTTATWSSERYAFLAAERPSFDVAIIDEAGQLTIPAILGALRFARRFILVGDEKQLPPLVLSKEAATAGLSQSLFSRLHQQNISSISKHPEAINASVSLRVQYRMHQTICNYSSGQFYAGTLESDQSNATRTVRYPLRVPHTEREVILKALNPNRPLVFLNVQDPTAIEGSKQSNREAEAVREVVAAMLRRGIQEEEIGVIAPFRAQVANLRRALSSPEPGLDWPSLSPDTSLLVDTVDRFQGGERPIIFISFATQTTPQKDSLLREFLTNPNRLNVALTRAQRKLILVGPVEALHPLPYFQQLIQYSQEMNTLFDF